MQGPRESGGRPVVGSAEADCPRERSVRRLYDTYAEMLHGYVLGQVGGDRQQAEDIVQETLLRAWRTPGLDESRPLRPWLFTVARRLVIDDYRRRSSRPEAVEDRTAGFGQPEREPVSDGDEIERVLSSLVVADALKALSAAHRAVLHETYFRGQTVQEAADVLGVPPGTVKSRVHYALRSLRLALHERGVTTARP